VGSAPPNFISGLLEQLAAAFGSLFEITTPQQRDALVHRLTLIAIMIAGAYLRFATLSAVGFHGDEETMALAVRHILIDGRPILPGGMFYPRGLTELYMMAASAAAFGMTEWALRVPAAVCGILLIPFAYLAGKRFLQPQWRLALATAVAFLPEIIEYSQTARMYIFLLLAICVALLCVFEWERSSRKGWLVGAVVAFIFGLDYQALAVTAVLLFLFPGLIQRDVRKLVWGAAAIAMVMAAYLVIEGLVSAQYPRSAGQLVRQLAQADRRSLPSIADFLSVSYIGAWLSLAANAGAALWTARAIRERTVRIALVVLFGLATVLQLVLFYHLAVLLYVCAAVIALRFGGSAALKRMLPLLGVAAIIACVHVAMLAETRETWVKLIGAMVGRPSVWPYVRTIELSEIAGLLLIAGLLHGLWQFAHRRHAADVWLFALLTVWVPIFVLGFFTWNMPPRYAAASLIPLLLSALAFVQYAITALSKRVPSFSGKSFLEPAIAALCAVFIIGPFDISHATPSYRRFPDHKGAAEFLQAQNVSAEDLVFAEDILEQQYYLGLVDYWLIGPRTGAAYSVRSKDGLRDIYTGTRVVTTSAELTRLVRDGLAAGHRVFIIGSGEDQSDGRRFARGDDLFKTLESGAFKTIYLGRDGLTRVMVPAEDAQLFSDSAPPVQNAVPRKP
jgi:hypothetical protein